jgi:tetratricopeptide (TPR) repeat protein
MQASFLSVTQAIVVAVPLLGCVTTMPLPRSAIDLNAAGALALAQGDLRSAEARLSVALEFSPQFVEAWINLGYVELRRANFAQARRDFVRARQLNDDLPAPHHALGLLSEDEGETAQAEAHYRAALQVDPGFTPSRVNLARLLYARGQYENAREQFLRLIAIAPDGVEGWLGEAETLLQLGREREAEGVVERARERLGQRPELSILVARQRMALGDWDDAEALLAPVVADRDRERAAAAWAWIAVARIGKRDAPRAREAALAALAIDGANAVAAYAMHLIAARERPRPIERR